MAAPLVPPANVKRAGLPARATTGKRTCSFGRSCDAVARRPLCTWRARIGIVLRSNVALIRNVMADAPGGNYP